MTCILHGHMCQVLRSTVLKTTLKESDEEKGTTSSSEV